MNGYNGLSQAEIMAEYERRMAAFDVEKAALIRAKEAIDALIENVRVNRRADSHWAMVASRNTPVPTAPVAVPESLTEV